jgi:transposase InsO family protein
MGAIGDSYDNAMAESLWASLKKELIYRTTFSTREVSRTAIFAFINWYKKDATGIGYLSPIQFGKKARIQAA